MDAKLVSSTGEGFEQHPGTAVFLPHFLPDGYTRFTIDGVMDLIRSVIDIKPEPEFNPAMLFRKETFHQGDVDFFRNSLFKLKR
jgi:hypothetical protein